MPHRAAAAATRLAQAKQLKGYLMPFDQLLADAYEQLGYQVESATARNAYLQGAWDEYFRLLMESPR